MPNFSDGYAPTVGPDAPGGAVWGSNLRKKRHNGRGRGRGRRGLPEQAHGHLLNGARGAPRMHGQRSRSRSRRRSRSRSRDRGRHLDQRRSRSRRGSRSRSQSRSQNRSRSYKNKPPSPASRPSIERLPNISPVSRSGATVAEGGRSNLAANADAMLLAGKSSPSPEDPWAEAARAGLATRDSILRSRVYDAKVIGGMVSLASRVTSPFHLSAYIHVQGGGFRQSTGTWRRRQCWRPRGTAVSTSGAMGAGRQIPAAECWRGTPHGGGRSARPGHSPCASVEPARL
jgi:hypothetical protein